MRLTKTPTLSDFASNTGQSFNQFAFISKLTLGVFCEPIIKPVLVFLTLPVTMLTLGLFIFVINALLVLLVAAVVPGFQVSGFWYALLFSVVLSFVSWVLHSFVKV